jgi:DNA-binding NarL/FixJ family response regulator
VTTVVIADDQDLVRAGFRLILGAAAPAIEVLGEAGDGAEAVRLVHELAPDVVVMDLRMPNVDGIEATRRIVASGSRSRVLMLTTFDADRHVYDAFRAGDSGFLLKNSPSEQLVDAVHSVSTGEALLAPTLTRRLIERFLAAPDPSAEATLEPLTERERVVLRLIARGLSNSEIAGELYLSVGTVKTHVNRILAKLDLRDRVQAAVLAYETGLVQPGPSSR